MLREEEAESLRLVYVALTRAVHRCYIAFGDIGRGDAASRSAMGYLLRPLDGRSIRESLTTMVEASDGCMTLEGLTGDTVSVMAVTTEQSQPELAARPLVLMPSQLDTWRLSSFTGLVADAPDGIARDVADPTVLSSSGSTSRRPVRHRRAPWCSRRLRLMASPAATPSPKSDSMK
jgi:exodeoxyribonuclease V beta subunit